MKRRYLTKSRFKLANECPTKLFYTNKKDQYDDQTLDDTFLKALAYGGFQVGELAKIYYPGGILIDTLDYDDALDQTRKLLDQPDVIIYEAALSYNSLFVRVDILVKKQNRIQIIEVKSKSFSSNEDSSFYDKRLLKRGYKKLLNQWQPYLEDIAFQSYVAQKSYPNYSFSPFLMLADKSKVSTVDSLNQRFFIIQNNNKVTIKTKEETNIETVGGSILCTIPVHDEIDLILNNGKFEENVNRYADSYEKDIKIPPRIGTQCKSCQFRSNDFAKSGFQQCWKEATDLKEQELNGPFVFDVWNFRKADEYIASGIYLMKDLPKKALHMKENNGPGLSSSQRQWQQIELCKKAAKEPYVDRQGLRAEISAWKYPLHFIDFETTMVAIPINKGRRPYEQIAFQFSHHQIAENGTIQHKGQYINLNVGAFPNFEFVRELKKELENDDGTIFRYASHENTVLCQIYDQLEKSLEPDRNQLMEWIKEVTTSKNSARGEWTGSRTMVDMCELTKRYYYNPAMKGSNSIKKVLPAILQSSSLLRKNFSEPVYGNAIASFNYQDWSWIQYDNQGCIIDPYKLLPTIFEGIEIDKLDFLMGNEELADGGAAMMAYAKMQFSEMTNTEREFVVGALLKYCELDTLAMVFLHIHFCELANFSLIAS